MRGETKKMMMCDEKRIEIEYQRLILEFAIEQFGEAVENFYNSQESLKCDSPEHKLANQLFQNWQTYLES